MKDMSAGRTMKLREHLIGFSKGIWFFPAVLLGIVLILSALQVSGSSIGVYHELFYGESSKDDDLLLNKPRSVRSDEWLVTTQLSLAQKRTDFAPLNTNIGDGIDMSLLVDAPTSDPIQLFKPHNLAFFVLPVGIAFALKWWLLAYFLVVAVYFFVLVLLPERKLLAALLALSFLASPFIGWWYQYITLAPIYYALFAIVVVTKLLHSRSRRSSLAWGALLAYIGVSFVLVLYPPFQIPCALFALAFLAGYVADHWKEVGTNLKVSLPGIGVAGGLIVLLAAVCLVPKLGAIETIGSTAYPGNRITSSGGFNATLFFASNTSPLAQSNSRAGAFSWLPNQSEGSNFLLVFTLALPALAFLAARYRKRIPNFWTVMALLSLTLVFLAWLFVPSMDLLGKLTLLDRVLHARLLIGFGLINLLTAVFIVQILGDRRFKLPKYAPLTYALVLLAAYTAVDLSIAAAFPGFMGEKWALLLALPYPLIIYLFLKGNFNVAATVLLLFSLASVIFIHPLYRGLDVLDDSPLSTAIREIDSKSSKRWVTDSLQLENFPAMNGKRSLSGVYVYPDVGLWESGFPAKDADKYNRYAHVHFQFDRDADRIVRRQLSQPSPDQLIPNIEPCDPFLRDNDVGYILTTQGFTREQAPCASILRQVSVPRANIYIYKLHF